MRIAFRKLLRNPGFAVVVALTVALGIGATSTVLALIQGALLTPPPYPKPDQVVLIKPARTDGQVCPPGFATSQWGEWPGQTRAFEAFAGYHWEFDFLVLPDGSESIEGLWVTSDYFRVIGVQPALGRAFLPAELSPKTHAVVILGDDLWRKRFDGDTNILGKVVHLSRSPPLTVVGVMPPAVRFLPSPDNHYPNYDVNAPVDYWLPDSLGLTVPKARYTIAARMGDGVTLAKAQAELTAIAARQPQADPDFPGMTARALSLTAELNLEGRRLLLPLLGAVLLVFLISCGNAAGLLLARGIQRQQEYAVRCALGAGRMQLFRLVLTESLLLALLGGVLGAGLAAVSIKTLHAVGGSAIPRLDAVRIGWPVLAFCSGAAVVAAVLAGLAPAFRASLLEPAFGVKGGGRTSPGRAERRLLGGITILQTGLTLALLMGAGLLIRTVGNLARVSPGYELQNVLTMSVTRPMDWDGFNVPALERVSALPAVKHAAFVWGLPLTGNNWITTVRVEGQKDTTGFKGGLAIPGRAVTPEYFDTVGLPIVSGRRFSPTDTRAEWKGFRPGPGERPFVVIINQALADRCFSKANPIGKKIEFSFENVEDNAEIVGIVADARTDVLTQQAGPEIYFSYWQLPAFSKHLVVRTATDPLSVIAAVRRELRAVDPTVAIEQVKTLERIRSDSVAPQTFAMRLLTAFSVVASALAAVGIYGLLSLSVGARKQEIAIRLEVGAPQRKVLGLFLREGMKLIALGLVVGTALAIGLAEILKAWLFGVEPTDPLTFAAVALLVAMVALLACWIPARRATLIDPMEALRAE